MRKKKRMMIFFSVLLLFVVGLPQPAQAALQQVVSEDTTRIVVRRPPPEVVQSFLDNPDYRYVRYELKTISWWQQLKQWFWRTLRSLFDDDEQGTYWEFLFYTFAIIAVLYAVFRLTGMNGGALFSSGGKAFVAAELMSEEDFKGKDYLALADEAINQKVYQTAARMYYLYVLKELNESGDIVWAPQKTNREYVAACKRETVRPAFKRLTYLFDYAWYGQFPVDLPLVMEMKNLANEIVRETGRRL